MITFCITIVYVCILSFPVSIRRKYQTGGDIPHAMALEASRGLHFYLEVLKTALDDEIITSDEASILKVLAVALGLSPSAVGDALDVARGIDPSPIGDTTDYESHQIGDVTTYQTALVAALDDEVISDIDLIASSMSACWSG